MQAGNTGPEKQVVRGIMNQKIVNSAYATLFALLSLSTAGCDASSDDAGEKVDDEPCGGNGEMNDEHGHCHCDEGYAMSPDGMDCVPSDYDHSEFDEEGSDGDGTGGEGTDFDPGSVVGVFYNGASPYQVLTAKHGRTWLSIENYPGHGGAEGAESRSIGTAEANYATCGVCMLVQTGCQQHGDHAHCDATFMPEVGGEIAFDALGGAVGEAWSGVLSNVQFVEVTINPRSYETTPVSDGERFDLGTWGFDVLLESN